MNLFGPFLLGTWVSKDRRKGRAFRDCGPSHMLSIRVELAPISQN